MMLTCPACGRTLDSGAQFCSGCGGALASRVALRPVTVRLVRPRGERMIAGVCAGFALRFGWEVVFVRLVLVLAVIFGVGTPVLAYLIAWIVMPNEQYALPPQAGVPYPTQTGREPGSIAM